ncbi:sensor histidine kinase [Maritalea mediterranea]|uniref:histidine kinase n=1 Tax=Maritalea mediterranea TaxID=2909667 RepID=A0ABS9E886_9HYPH|nr:ATP-binding protein [Maritalea mediterranea]MCF4097638.1 ATP-binding protein [Maritalea mediterranea]
MFTASAPKSLHSQRRRLAAALIAVFLLSVAFLVIYAAAFSTFKASELDRAQGRADFYRTTLESALDRLEHLPFIVGQDPAVVRGLTDPTSRDALNRRLEDFATRANAEALYVMNLDGLTIAASNHAQAVNFIGENYSFRPYFQTAKSGQRGKFFAIGATTKRPGFFVAEPVRNAAGKIIGVIALKIELDELVEAWQASGEKILITNLDSIIVLASQPEWHYQTLSPISEERLLDIRNMRQFGQEALQPLDWQRLGDDEIALAGERHIGVRVPVRSQPWELHFIVNTAGLQERALFVVFLAAISVALLAILFIFWRSERLRRALHASHQDRQRLLREIEERKATEKALAKTQEELEKSSRMAALGQLAASVTHELGQPLSAMRNYIAIEEMGAAQKPDSLATRLSALVRRMENITRDLRFFAQPKQDQQAPFDVAKAIENAVELVRHDLKQRDIDLQIKAPLPGPQILGNGARFEQVLVNLLRNAISAVEQAKAPRIELGWTRERGQVVIYVADNGHGLKGQQIEELQEPFRTDKPSGEGMGLGLAISASIVKEHAGELFAQDNDHGGATFTVLLPPIPQDQTEGET